MMPNSDTPRSNLKQPCNAKSEGGGERILAVMDRSDQADTKQRKLHHLACAPLQPSPPYPSKLAADPMAQVEVIVCLDLYNGADDAFVLHPFPFEYLYDVCKHASMVSRLLCAVIAWIFCPLY